MSKKALSDKEAWDIQEQYKDQPHGWIQWKGTDVCMDIHCKCGYLSHIDDEFVYSVKCPKCGTVYFCNGHIELIELEQEPENVKHSVSSIEDVEWPSRIENKCGNCLSKIEGEPKFILGDKYCPTCYEKYNKIGAVNQERCSVKDVELSGSIPLKVLLGEKPFGIESVDGRLVDRDPPKGIQPSKPWPRRCSNGEIEPCNCPMH